MQQPQFPNSSQQSPPSTTKDSNSTSTPQNSDSIKQKLNIPTPKELISHYESQGMNQIDASLKVIDDLQYMLYRISTSDKGKEDKFMSETSRKLDMANARLAVIDMKLDSKPGYPQSVAIGVASAAAFRGVAAVWPQVASAAANVWNSVRGSTNT